MDLIATAVLVLVGGILTSSSVGIFKQYRQGDTLLFGKATVAFAVLLTVAYYLSIVIILL